MNRNFWIIGLLALIIALSSCNSGGPNNAKNKVIIFHAGSLSVPFKSIIEEYKKANPEVEIFAESSGSLDAARKITDLKKDCDILAVSDYLVIDNLLIPDFAEWNFVFASNEMVIAYNEKSKNSTEINAKNWHEILLENDIVIARSEPNADPCGYRSVFVFKLSEKFYNNQNLAEKLLNKENTVIRPKEVDLIALLETGNVDYLMIYKSVALQHNLKFVELPDEINLSNPDMENLYNQVSTSVNGSKPEEMVEIKGSAILYSFTVPKTAKNLEQAIKFVSFLTDPEKGGKILAKEGMGVINYSQPKYLDKLPKDLKSRLN